MHILTIPGNISDPILIDQGLALQPGEEYICTNAFVGQMLLSRFPVLINGAHWSLRMFLKANPITIFPFDPSHDWNNKDIWLYRGGGYGDLLMLTPLIREIKYRWPKSRVHISCSEHHHSMFYGIDVIPELVPIPYSIFNKIGALIEFEELVEGNPKAKEMHMAELFAAQANMLLSDLTLEYHIKDEEREWALKTYPVSRSRPRIGIQFLASAFYRSYPHMGKVMIELAKEADVFLFGSPGQITLKEPMAHVINLMDDKLDFRQSAAVLSTCQSCVAPDSAMVHLCSALKIPCVGLYGPFPSHLRKTSDLGWFFNGKAWCAPCFFHAEFGNQFPEGMPCSETKRCVALESIDPERVAKKAMSFCVALH